MHVVCGLIPRTTLIGRSVERFHLNLEFQNSREGGLVKTGAMNLGKTI